MEDNFDSGWDAGYDPSAPRLEGSRVAMLTDRGRVLTHDPHDFHCVEGSWVQDVAVHHECQGNRCSGVKDRILNAASQAWCLRERDTDERGRARALKACCTPLCEAPTRRHVIESSRDPRKVSSTTAAGASLATYSLYS
jgi:hypothetical protein